MKQELSVRLLHNWNHSGIKSIVILYKNYTQANSAFP